MPNHLGARPNHDPIPTDRLVDSPDNIKQEVLATYQQTGLVNDWYLDGLLLGLDVVETEQVIFNEYLVGADQTEEMIKLKAAGSQRFEDEEIWARGGKIIWTGYEAVRNMLKELGLEPDQTFYDLGSGYGRVVLYAGIVTEAVCKGIELVPERARLTQKRAEVLELPNVSFEETNVLDADFTDGDVFYLYSPFSDETLPRVTEALGVLASQKPITIAARGNRREFREQHWLETVGTITARTPARHMTTIEFYKSLT